MCWPFLETLDKRERDPSQLTSKNLNHPFHMRTAQSIDRGKAEALPGSGDGHSRPFENKPVQYRAISHQAGSCIDQQQQRAKPRMLRTPFPPVT